MLQSITTHYVGPTNHRGARICAKSASGERLTVPLAYGSRDADDHKHAAQLLADKLCWSGRFVGGTTADGYVFVTLTDNAADSFTI